MNSGTSVGRISALLLLYLYLLRGLWPHIIETAYWQTIQVII